MDKYLEVINLEKYYGSASNVTKAVDNISFSVNKGEFLAIMGPSGSGKSTLLNCLATFDFPTAGKILLQGKDITRLSSRGITEFRRSELGFIFQDFNLIANLTAWENIALAMTISNSKSELIHELVDKLARRLNIQDCLDKYPKQLSGGQQQRVACARAMITNPSLILADEPTGSIDSEASRSLLKSFEILNKENESTIIMVTHDAYASSYCNRVLFMQDGKIYNELVKGNQDRTTFFKNILSVISLMGGDFNGN